MTGNMKIKSLLPTAADGRETDHHLHQQQQRRGGGANQKGLAASGLVVEDSYDDSRAELVAMNHNLVSTVSKRRLGVLICNNKFLALWKETCFLRIFSHDIIICLLCRRLFS